MEQITKFLIKTVKKASKMITPQFEIKAKDENGDLVTNFDFEIEKFIISKIKKHYPTFDIVSEEFNSLKTVTENCFVIDPIDGTINFAHGLPLWGIQVACVQNGTPCSSVIFLPKLHELYYADKSGAFCNNKQISVIQRPLKQALFAVDGKNKPPSFARLFKINQHVKITGVSCVNYAWLASGKFSGVIYKRESVWDYLPGQYLVECAGGVVLNSENEHISASNMEFAKLLKKECGFYKNDTVTTTHD